MIRQLILVAISIAVLVAGHPSIKEAREAAQTRWDYTYGFSGISTFGHLAYRPCLREPDLDYDIGIIGVPFDTAVSYRPGARFGPRAIRAASNRHLPSRSFSPYAGVNPYHSWATIYDCGDVPTTPFDNSLALHQMTEALTELTARPWATDTPTPRKLLILGGDHSVSLPALRAMSQAHGQPLAVVHFDAHLDTLHPTSYPATWTSTQSEFTHGTMLWQAWQEGLIRNGSSVHAGLRTRLSGDGWSDYEHDDRQGFDRLSTEDIDRIGPQGIVDAILARVPRGAPVYLSIDIDVLDPSTAPGTGAPEPGGWTMREMNHILRGLHSLNIIGADILEVSPAYDDRSETTSFAAAQIAYEIITLWVKRGLARGDEDNSKDEL